MRREVCSEHAYPKFGGNTDHVHPPRACAHSLLGAKKGLEPWFQNWKLLAPLGDRQTNVFLTIVPDIPALVPACFVESWSQLPPAATQQF